MSNDLLPCPFCGDVPVFASNTEWFRLECRGCGVKTANYVHDTVALARWNRRAPAQPEGWDGQERRNAAPAKRWCTVTHTHQPHDDCDGTAAPAGELDTLPDEPDCVKIWRARADFFPAAQDAVAYMDALRQSATRLQAELAEAKSDISNTVKALLNVTGERNDAIQRAESAERRAGELGSLIVEAILSTTDEHTEQLLRDNCPEWDTWNRNALARGRD